MVVIKGLRGWFVLTENESLAVIRINKCTPFTLSEQLLGFTFCVWTKTNANCFTNDTETNTQSSIQTKRGQATIHHFLSLWHKHERRNELQTDSHLFSPSFFRLHSTMEIINPQGLWQIDIWTLWPAAVTDEPAGSHWATKWITASFFFSNLQKKHRVWQWV